MQRRCSAAKKLYVAGVSLLAVLLTGLVLAACSTPAGLMKDSESKYNIGTLAFFDTNLRIYHSALLDPAGIHLDTNGYVVGIEKVDTYDNKPGPRRVTHVIEYGGVAANTGTTGANAAAPCIIFSLLTSERASAAVAPEPMGSCPDSDLQADYLSNFSISLQNRLHADRFSHIMVMVMGWNTDQEEAVKNYNQIANNLRAAARQMNGTAVHFRPLVIGVSWPSEWALGDWSAFPSAAVRGASFWAKKDQADDVGRFFLADIITKAVLPARERIAPDTPLIMIGHSFGARALAAMFPNWKSAFYEKTPWDTRQYVAPSVNDFTFRPNDRLILLEGAFDISELFEGNGLLQTLQARKIAITMTSSQIDKAFDLAIWGDYVGDTRTFSAVCGTPPRHIPAAAASDFRCSEAVREGSWGLQLCNNIISSPPYDAARQPLVAQIHYYDASRLINCQTPFGGGGAHDDFNRPEMGRFLWSEIETRPP